MASGRAMTYHLAALTLFLVAPPPAGAAEPGLSLGLELASGSAYVSEAVPVTVTLRTSNPGVRNIGYPRLKTPGLNVGHFQPPLQSQEESGEGTVTVYRFPASVTPRNPGTITVGPARLDCDLLDDVGASYFGAALRHASLTSPMTELTVRPLPREGRPASFHGAIGSFRMTVRAKPAAAATGDPITITAVITGSGDVSPDACPSLAAPGVRSYQLRGSRTDSGIRCEQVIIPTASLDLPPLEWSYFDPSSASYRTLRAPLPVREVVRQAAAVSQVGATPTASRPAVPAPGPKVAEPAAAPRNLWHPMALLLPFLPVAPMVWAIRRSRKSSTTAPVPHRPEVSVADDEVLAGVESAIEQEDCEFFYTTLFRAVQGALASASAHPFAHSIAGTGEVEIADASLRSQLERLSLRCDQVRYGRVAVQKSVMLQDLAAFRTAAAAGAGPTVKLADSGP